jgi:peptide/nickel transport system substrate-binding protein
MRLLLSGVYAPFISRAGPYANFSNRQAMDPGGNVRAVEVTNVSRRLLGRNRVIGLGVAAGLALTTALAGGVGSASAASSLPGLYGSLPPVGGAAKTGGTITVGQISGSTPNYIFPITPAASGSVYNSYSFQNYMFNPLYFSPTGSAPKIDPSLSMASEPKYTNGGKTVTVTMKQGFTWANGAPVDANDVIFYIDVLKAAVKLSPSNFSNYTPGFFPDSVVSATATSKYTFQLQLNKVYNPGFFTNNQLGLIVPLPSTSWDVSSAGGPALDYTQPANAAAIYTYLAAQAKDLSTYATNPLWQDTDGPLKLSAYTSATGAFSMVPNSSYGGPYKAKYATLKYETFTSYQAEFNQLKLGNLTVGPVDFSVLPQVKSIESKYSVFGYPDFGFEAAFYNFKDTTGDWDKIIGQTYIRQVFAELEDEPGYIKGLFKGAAGLAYGPIPATPASPYAPANAKKAPFPYSVSTAAKTLKAHGWKVVPNGKTTCAKPGTGASECGAGIPAGTTIAPNIFYTNQPDVIGQQVEALASAAKGVGINITPISKTFNFIISNYSVASSPANNKKWAIEDFGGFTNSLYPTTNQIFNIGGSYNEGGYDNTKATALINDSVFASNNSAVTNEDSYLTTQQPALFQPAPDEIYAVSKSLSAVSEDDFTAMTQYQPVPQGWYFKK